MHDIARPAAKDCVELVLARWRKARVAALLEADEFLIAVVPATGPLIEVAAYRSLIPNLWGADFICRRTESGIHPRDFGVLGDIDHSHRGADPQPAI
jgi:hypothetical protein